MGSRISVAERELPDSPLGNHHNNSRIYFSVDWTGEQLLVAGCGAGVTVFGILCDYSGGDSLSEEREIGVAGGERKF